MPKLVIQEGYRQVGEFQLPEKAAIVGRSPESDLVLASRGVSREHFKITRTGNNVVIEDLGSRNGTFLNSIPIDEVITLKHKDIIQIGSIVLVYQEVDDNAEDNTFVSHSEEDASDDKRFDIAYLQQISQNIKGNIAKVVRGKDEVIERILLGLFSDGHILLEDVPGVGKTVVANALAKSIRTEFKRVQFTPDLLPTDITGVNIYDEQTRAFNFIPGPIFANVILADEINRGTPRAQSSLLECMAEGSITVDGTTHVLQKPFFVIATQNPTDFHGTYPLPEAQLDRFLMRLNMGYPDKETEREILGSQITTHPINSISYVVRSTDIQQCQALIRKVHLSEQVKDYIVTIIRATREHPAFTYGCSPRASLALMRVSQAKAAFSGRDYVIPRDVRDLATTVLAHRLPLKLQAKTEWESSQQVLELILEKNPIEKWEKS